MRGKMHHETTITRNFTYSIIVSFRLKLFWSMVYHLTKFGLIMRNVNMKI